MKKEIRIQKFIADSGYCSRRKAESFITLGKVFVNGKKLDEFGLKINPEKDRVEVNGKRIIIKQKSEKIYIILNKPPGYISSCNHKGRKIILDLINIKERIYPVGRLDSDSRGLILLTNDGPLHNILSHPSFDHEKEYIVETNSPLTKANIKNFSSGLFIEGVKTRKAIIKKAGEKEYRIILKEGRNRQIRKMMETLNKKVIDLKRIRIASLTLGNLKEGKWRYLTQNEVKSLKKITKK